MTIASDNVFPKVILEEGAAPATPSSGQVKVYAKSDGLVYSKDDAGVETGPFGGSGVADIVDIPTAETDTSLVLAPDGAGGVEFRAEAGGSGGGGLTLLEQHTASTSTSLDFTAFISSTYDEYLFEFLYVLPVTDNVDLMMRVSTNGGSSYDTGSNYESIGYRNYSGGSAADGGTGTAFVIASPTDHIDNDANYGGVSGWLRLYRPGGSIYKLLTGTVTHKTNATNSLGQRTISLAYKSATAIDAVQFYMSSGNISSGTIRVYGVAKS